MAIIDFTKTFGKISEFVAGIIEKLKGRFEKRIWSRFIYTYTFVATKKIEGRVIYRNTETGEAYKRPLTPIEKEIVKKWEEKGILRKEKERIDRKLEGRIVSYIPVDLVEDKEFEDKIKIIFENYIRERAYGVKRKEGTYEFIFEQPNLVSNPHSFRYDYVELPLTLSEMQDEVYKEYGIELNDDEVMFFIELYDHTYNRSILSTINRLPINYYELPAVEILKLLGV